MSTNKSDKGPTRSLFPVPDWFKKWLKKFEYWSKLEGWAEYLMKYAQLPLIATTIGSVISAFFLPDVTRWDMAINWIIYFASYLGVFYYRHPKPDPPSNKSS